MIGFNKLENDFKAMRMSFCFLCRDISCLISRLFCTICGFVTFIFIRNANQGSLISLKRSWIKVIKRFKRVFKRTIALCIALFIFIVSTPLFLIKLPLVWLRNLLDGIPLGDFGRDKEIRGLILTIISVFVLGVFCSVVVSVITIYSEKLYQKDICFTDKCVTTFFYILIVYVSFFSLLHG